MAAEDSAEQGSHRVVIRLRASELPGTVRSVISRGTVFGLRTSGTALLKMADVVEWLTGGDGGEGEADGGGRGAKATVVRRAGKTAAKTAAKTAVGVVDVPVRGGGPNTATKPDRGARRGTVDINTAPVDALVAIVHIDDERARQIVVAREDRPFESLDELRVRVSGIGPARLDEIRAEGVATAG